MLELAVTLAVAAAPLRVAVPELRGVGLGPDVASFQTEHLSQSLRKGGLVVVTHREIVALLSLERQRELLGCAEATSCIAELANALGADAVVLGDVARFKDTFQINLKLLSASDAKVLVEGTRRVEGEISVLDALTELGRTLAREALAKTGRAPTESEPPKTARKWPWIPIAGGGALAITGAVLFGLSRSDYAELTGVGERLSAGSALSLRTGGATKQALGAAGLIGGPILALAGLAFLLVGQPDTPLAALSPTEAGWVFSITGLVP